MDDIPNLLPLVEAYWDFEGIPGFELDRVGGALRRLLSSRGAGFGMLAIEGEAAVGYLLAVSVFSLEHCGWTGEIDELFVRPEARRSGAGSALLRAAEAELARAGCSHVSLQLARCNDSARAFYTARGYAARSKYELLERSL